MKKAITLVDRKTGELFEETVMGDGALRFAYETFLGHCLRGLLFNTSGLSRLMGWYYDSALSKKSISSLASIPGCDPREAELPLDKYTSFNDFFTRRLKKGVRPFDEDPFLLASPADGRIAVFENLTPEGAIPVKGAERSLNDLCCENLKAPSLAAAVIRLAPVDYHRYHFPCSCLQKEPPRKVRGKYHSVNPVALAKYPDLYCENTRQITTLESDVFGTFRYLEVGAFGVGSIIQHSAPGEHAKQDEKGCFKFGGSTVILVFDNARIRWSADLLENSSKGYETIVRCGETIGSALK